MPAHHHDQSSSHSALPFMLILALASWLGVVALAAAASFGISHLGTSETQPESATHAPLHEHLPSIGEDERRDSRTSPAGSYVMLEDGTFIEYDAMPDVDPEWGRSTWAD